MPLLDPRGQLRLERVSLAPFPGRDTLTAGSVLFYDNLKMEVGHYPLLIPRIKDGLRRSGIARFVDHRETIRGKSPSEIGALARTLADMRPLAAVIALADMGVSPAMVALTVALEQSGIPTICITAEPGSSLAAAHAHYRAGTLRLLDLDIFPASMAHEVNAAADACSERIAAMLMGNAAAAPAAKTYPIDTSPASADGYLPAMEGDDEAIYEEFEALHIGDGLPFIAPTQARFERMREYCPFDADEVIVTGVGPSGTAIRVRDVLVAAVMAGCRPHYAPIVLTAVRAIARPQYGLLQAVTTSFSGGHFVLASGPISHEIGMHGGQGCLGPGFRANATIGRAVNLTLLNVCRSVPGHADLACLSSPAELAYCFAEDRSLSPWPALNEERFAEDPRLSPWPPIHEERFDAETTCVMTLKAEAPHNVLDIGSTDAAGLMETIIDCCTTLGSNNASTAGPLVLVLNPDHAQILARGGYDKTRLRREIHASARIALDRMAARGIVSVAAQQVANGFHRVTRSPDDVQIVVAGSKGGHSAAILPWGLYSEAVFEPVRLPHGSAAKSLAELRRSARQ